MEEENVVSPNEYRPTLTSPEGLLMLAMACVADGLGILYLALDLLFGVGEVVHILTDIFFTIIFSVWMMARGGSAQVGSKFSNFLKKRLGWMLLDYIPIFGDIWPSWIIVVVKFLRDNEKNE